MKKKLIVLILIIIIGVILFILNNSSNSNEELIQKGYEIFGDNYCTTDHSKEFGGDAFTDWECSLCEKKATNPDTNTPVLCNSCANITERCSKCGKLLEHK